VASPSAETGQSEENVDLMRERVWRDLAREAANERAGTAANGGGGGGWSSSSSDTAVGYANDSPSMETQQQQQQQSASSTSSSSPSPSSQQQTEGHQQQQQQKGEVNFLGYVGRPYQTPDLLRNIAFGATIGSITGMCFGFMDSIRLAQSSDVLKSASRSAQGKFVFQGTYRSGMFFGAFFGAFHAIKYGARVPGDAGEILAGGEWRASLPYATMLVAMDSIHVFMREEGKA